MPDSFLQKQDKIRKIFGECLNEEARYNKIIELGRNLHHAPLDLIYKKEENIVQGCQSTMYLRSYMMDGKIYFESDSDALISAGLAALLTFVYSGESPETVLRSPPHYLEELKISASLSPSRANGLYSVHLRMKQDALKMLTNPPYKAAFPEKPHSVQ
jgi:cysteine desulfuration protein SufE